MVALPNYDMETSTRLQIFLDNNNFGPGKIDGEMGEFFRKALLAYKAANGLPMTGAVDPIMLAEVPEVFTNYTDPAGRREAGRQRTLCALAAGETEMAPLLRPISSSSPSAFTPRRISSAS